VEEIGLTVCGCVGYSKRGEKKLDFFVKVEGPMIL
jgi:hypothetical protein